MTYYVRSIEWITSTREYKALEAYGAANQSTGEQTEAEETTEVNTSDVVAEDNVEQQQSEYPEAEGTTEGATNKGVTVDAAKIITRFNFNTVNTVDSSAWYQGDAYVQEIARTNPALYDMFEKSNKAFEQSKTKWTAPFTANAMTAEPPTTLSTESLAPTIPLTTTSLGNDSVTYDAWLQQMDGQLENSEGTTEANTGVLGTRIDDTVTSIKGTLSTAETVVKTGFASISQKFGLSGGTTEVDTDDPAVWLKADSLAQKSERPESKEETEGATSKPGGKSYFEFEDTTAGLQGSSR